MIDRILKRLLKNVFYAIERWIVEEQQQGESRAKYGQRIIKRLFEILTEQYVRGFSVDT